MCPKSFFASTRDRYAWYVSLESGTKMDGYITARHDLLGKKRVSFFGQANVINAFFSSDEAKDEGMKKKNLRDTINVDR